MSRIFSAMAMLAAVSLEPAAGPTDFDLIRYGITQGGLLIVVIILFWSYRRDFLRIQQKDEEKIVVLTALVSENTVAFQRVAAGLEGNEKATHRLARAIEDRR